MEELINMVEGLKKFSVDELITGKSNNLGTLKFHESKPAIQQIKNIIEDFNLDAIKELPPDKKNYLNTHFKAILRRLYNLRDAEISKNQTIDQAKEQFKVFFDLTERPQYTDRFYVANHLPTIWEIISIANNNYARKHNQIKDLEEIRKKLITELEEAGKKNTELSRKLEIRRDEFASEAVKVHISNFEDEASEQQARADKWRKLLYYLISSTGIFMTLMFIISIFEWFKEHNIELAVFSAVIITFLSYLIMFVVKNYNAAKHNATLARHRANCLSTFDELIEGEDPERKSVVLQYACQTIFPHQLSGYLAKEADGSNPNPIISSIDKFSDAKSVTVTAQK